MGTRGAIGFRIGGVDKVTYNHFDSYPTGIGVGVVSFLKDTPDSKLVAMAQEIKLVDGQKKPTKAQIKKCQDAGTVDLGVSEKSTSDWYCLMRGAQGNLGGYGKIGLMIDNHEFLVDSLFCEYAYILNMDTMELEIYKGFNKTAGGKGRYAGLKEKPGKDGEESEYYGVSLFRSVPFREIREMDYTPEKYCEELEKEMNKEEEVEA